jgi:hypothetical protein
MANSYLKPKLRGRSENFVNVRGRHNARSPSAAAFDQLRGNPTAARPLSGGGEASTRSGQNDSRKDKRSEHRRLAANCVDRLASILPDWTPSTDLNQAKDISPARFFAPSRPANRRINVAGRKEGKNHESTDSLQKPNNSATLCCPHNGIVARCDCHQIF